MAMPLVAGAPGSDRTDVASWATGVVGREAPCLEWRGAHGLRFRAPDWRRRQARSGRVESLRHGPPEQNPASTWQRVSTELHLVPLMRLRHAEEARLVQDLSRRRF
jgi:hypothetical protein